VPTVMEAWHIQRVMAAHTTQPRYDDCGPWRQIISKSPKEEVERRVGLACHVGKSRA